MLENSNEPLLYLRFGIQRKKAFLKDIRQAYDGLVLPANILLYQYRSTPTVVLMCDKPFFVDPMSYLFGQPYEAFKTRVKKGSAFKPSFRRLLAGHGLAHESFLKVPYTALLSFLSEDDKNLHQFVDNALDFQSNRVGNTIRDADELVTAEQRAAIERMQFSPSLVIPPYFLYSENSPDKNLIWSLNAKILDYCAKGAAGRSVFPLVFVDRFDLGRTGLTAAVRQATDRSFPGYCLWIAGFDERFATREEAVALVETVKKLAAGGAQVVMLFGGFFSLLLKKFGLSCVSHGLAYSESRALEASASQTSGPAPVRYYVLELHRFLTLEDSLLVLRERPELLCSCPVCRRVLQGDPERVTLFSGQEELAEMHFLHTRQLERRMIANSSLDELVAQLEWARTLVLGIDKIMKPVSRDGQVAGERPILSLDYLKNWKEALAGR